MSDATCDIDDGALAAVIASTAGALLATVQRCGLFQGHAMGKLGDAMANDVILRALAAHRPQDAVLSEEAVDDATRCARSRVWIVDPLDGTREYGEGRDDWAVHVALAIDGRAKVGAVALPALGLTLSSAAPGPLAPANRPPKMVVSRTRRPAETQSVAEAIGAELLEMGSAGAKAMAVVRGDADIYLHSGGQHEWDNCAPAAVAAAWGLHVSRLDGSPPVYNRPQPSVPDLLICRPEWANPVLTRIGADRRGEAA